jgi:NAD(P)-dependent dehydrogenase (short-subunit alcohol dehydrogenase family)
MAKLLVAEGHEVWGTSRNLERIPKMPQWHAVRLDLADPLSVEAAFNSALTDAGYFDVVINNAGAGHFDPAELVPMETIAGQFQILVFGQIQLMQLALRHMHARGEGLIINVTVSFPASSAVYGGLTQRKRPWHPLPCQSSSSSVIPRHVVDLQSTGLRTELLTRA